MISRKTKPEIVEAVLELNKDNPNFGWNNLPIDKLVYSWFVTGRTGSGLRLSDEGEAAFKVSELQSYECPLGYSFSYRTINNILLDLDKNITCPYYIFTKTLDSPSISVYIKLYEHKTAFMVNIYGDMKAYIDSLKSLADSQE